MPGMYPSLSEGQGPDTYDVPGPTSLITLPPVPVVGFLRPLFGTSFVGSPMPGIIIDVKFLYSVNAENDPLVTTVSVVTILPLPSEPWYIFTVFVDNPYTSGIVCFPLITIVDASDGPSPPSTVKVARI